MSSPNKQHWRSTSAVSLRYFRKQEKAKRLEVSHKRCLGSNSACTVVREGSILRFPLGQLNLRSANEALSFGPVCSRSCYRWECTTGQVVQVQQSFHQRTLCFRQR